jgi:tetratricopeptide (TPR) repeat protein
LLVVLGVVLLTAVGVFGLHLVQNRRHASNLKDNAAKLLADASKDPEKADQAIQLLEQYIKYEPKDEATYRSFADANFDRAKRNGKQAEPAMKAAEGFLRQFPGNTSERKKLIDLYMDRGRLDAARQHIRILLDAGGEFRNDVNLLDKAATCEIGLGGDIAVAVDHLDKAIQTKNAPPALVERLLVLLQTTKAYNDPRFTPSKYVGILVNDEQYRSNVEARVTAGRFLLHTGDLTNARRHITDALAMPGGATNSEALMAAAELERAEIKGPESVVPQMKKARAHLETAFNLDKRNVRAGLMLAECLTDLSEPKAAVDVLRQAAEALGDENSDLMQKVVDKLLDLDERELSGRLIERIARNEADRERIVKYFRGRVEVLKKEWAAARPLLEGVAPNLVRVPEFHKKAMAGLGWCYAAIHNPDKQSECFTAALADDPYFVPARIGLADADFKLGKFAEALAEYKTLVNGYGLKDFRTQFAKLEFRAAIRQPGANRNWSAFEAALGPAQDWNSEQTILHADMLVARGEWDAARTSLETLLRKDKNNATAWLALARALRRGGAPAPDAQQSLNAFADQIGDSVDLRLAKALLLLDRNRKPQPADFRKLTEAADKFEKDDRRRLLFGLGETTRKAAVLADDAKAMRELSIEFLRGAADLDAADVLARSAIVDLAILNDRKDIIGGTLAEIAKIEGDKGPMGTLAKVILRLPELKQIDDKAARSRAIQDQRNLLLDVKKLRPAWGRLFVVLAQLDELEGLNDAALANYKEAIDKGERQEFVVRRAVELYRDRRQDDLAALLLNQLYTEMNLPDDLERFRAIKDLLARDIPKSERPLIERIAPADSKEWRILLLRGSLLAAIGADEDAQGAFLAAVRFGDNVPDTWSALVAHLVRGNKIDRAKQAVEQAEQVTPPKTDAGRADLLIAIAGCWEMVGDKKKAEDKYRESLRIAPRELNPNRDLIAFLQRTNRGTEAENSLKQLVENPAQDLARWARRHLAMTTIAKRDAYQNRAYALQLVERNLAASPNDPEDVKCKAVVQTIDPVTREEGMKTLKGYAQFGDLTPDEFLLLGRLHFEQGKVFESVDFFEKAARLRAGLTAEHIAGLIRVYCGIYKLGSARAAMERLKAFAPQSWEAAREEARVLHHESLDAEKRAQPDEAKKLRGEALDVILRFPNARTEESIRRRSGPFLEELGFHDAAETLYKRLLTDSKEPYPHFPYASFLVRRKRTAEAIALAKKYEATTPPVLTARIRTGAIRTKSPSRDEERETAAWLDAKLKSPMSKVEQVGLELSRAELYEALGDYDKAINGYREALLLAKGAKPEEIQEFGPELIANNLAMVLVLHRPSEADEAIKLMNDVIAVRGPAPVFLDTRAVAYILKGGMSEEAAQDLQLALIQQRKAAYLFHLAWAYDLNPSKHGLREQALEEARKLGITPDDLHPMENLKFNQLFRKK